LLGFLPLVGELLFEVVKADVVGGIVLDIAHIEIIRTILITTE